MRPAYGVEGNQGCSLMHRRSFSIQNCQVPLSTIQVKTHFRFSQKEKVSKSPRLFLNSTTTEVHMVTRRTKICEVQLAMISTYAVSKHLHQHSFI